MIESRTPLYFAVGGRGVGGGSRRRRIVDEPGETLAGDGKCEDEESSRGDGVAREKLCDGEHVHRPITPVTRRMQRKVETHLQT